jgi:hypothetical protein
MLSLKASKASPPIIRSQLSCQPSRPTRPQSLATKADQPTATTASSSLTTSTPPSPPATPLSLQLTQSNILLSHAVPPIQPSARSSGATTKKIREWKEYNNVQRALKKQLATAVDKIYLEAHYDNVGYENVSIRTLIQYLLDEYGDITPINLRANAKRLNEEWDPNQPTQTLFSQIKEIQTYAQARNRTFTDQQIVDVAYTIIYNTGIYFDDCDTWLGTFPANQTWTNFQTHFNTAHRKAKRKQRTTQSGGYQGANAAIKTETALQAESEAATEALANMATAMSADHTTMSQLTKAITDLITPLTDKNNEISSLKARLGGTDSNSSDSNNSHSNNNNSNNNSNINNNSNNIYRRNSNSNTRTSMWTNGKHLRDTGRYCWTHGYCATTDHMSANCFKQNPGHKTEATRENNMGCNE